MSTITDLVDLIVSLKVEVQKRDEAIRHLHEEMGKLRESKKQSK